MNIPRFTAEASFYKTSWHYQTSRHMINLSAQMISAINPAAIDVISVSGCRPGLWEIRDGDNVTCIDPDILGGGGGGGGGYSGGEPSGDGPGGGPGGGGRPAQPPNSGYNPALNKQCHAEIGTQGTMNHYKIYEGRYKRMSSGPNRSDWFCCFAEHNCINCQDDPKRCQDGVARQPGSAASF